MKADNSRHLAKAAHARAEDTRRRAVTALRQLVNTQQAVTVSVNMDIYHSPEWVRVGRMLADVLRDYPDLRATVAAKLGDMVEAAEAQP